MVVNLKTKKLVDLVLHHSISLEEKDRLLIQFNPKYFEYANIFATKARYMGASVRYDPISFDSGILRGLISRFDKQEWAEELKRRSELARWCNTRVLIDCELSTEYARGIDDAVTRIAEFNRLVVGPYKKVLYRPGPHSGDEVRWNIVAFPSIPDAKAAGMSFSDYQDFVYSATIANDWRNMGESMEGVKSVFDAAKNVHIVVPGLTDLHLSIDGREGKICNGKRNMPDGEVFYGPVEDSINGYIYFQIPSRVAGLGVVEGIRLRFVNGVVTEYSAKVNEQALEKMLNMDKGSRSIGELGLGCNYGIKKPILETLFDEKIGGTVHLALGKSISKDFICGGGLNDSNIHWDIICDLRRNPDDLTNYPGGQIIVDGKTVQENGEWKI